LLVRFTDYEKSEYSVSWYSIDKIEEHIHIDFIKDKSVYRRTVFNSDNYQDIYNADIRAVLQWYRADPEKNYVYMDHFSRELGTNLYADFEYTLRAWTLEDLLARGYEKEIDVYMREIKMTPPKYMPEYSYVCLLIAYREWSIHKALSTWLYRRLVDPVERRKYSVSRETHNGILSAILPRNIL
jgi:hypothetical protein